MPRTVVYGAARDLLIAATVEVVAAKGLRGLTFRAVAERVGVANSLVAQHFGSREGLLAATLDAVVERSIETTRLVEFGSRSAFAETFMASLTVDADLQAFQYDMILEARRNPVFSGPVDRLYRRYLEVLTESLRRGGFDVDTGFAARLVFAALDGLVVQYLAGVDEDELRGTVQRLWESLSAFAR